MKVGQKEAWWPEVYLMLPWEAGEGLSAHLTGAQEDWPGPGTPLPQCPRRSQPVDQVITASSSLKEERPWTTQAFTAVRNGPATQPTPPASKNPPHSQSHITPIQEETLPQGLGSLPGNVVGKSPLGIQIRVVWT